VKKKITSRKSIFSLAFPKIIIIILTYLLYPDLQMERILHAVNLEACHRRRVNEKRNHATPDFFLGKEPVNPHQQHNFSVILTLPANTVR
jgi:hypothetical protein